MQCRYSTSRLHYSIMPGHLSLYNPANIFFFSFFQPRFTNTHCCTFFRASLGLHFQTPTRKKIQIILQKSKIFDFFTCKGKPRMGLPVISQDQVIYCTQTRVWTGVCVCAHNKS